MSGEGSADKFEYRGWRVHLELRRVEVGLFTGDADLVHMGRYVCRVSLPTPCSDRKSARWALDSMARDHIDAQSVKAARTEVGDLEDPY